MVCRGVNREKLKAEANSELAFALKDELKASPLFVEPITLGELTIKKEESTNTFYFTLSVTLKHPLKP
jgi:hypothetical protein